MPCWYYEKKDLKRETPSIHDGIDFETESRYRKEGARFIIDTGTKMGLRYDTMATGVVYFHRFYMFHSFKEFPRYVTACCWYLFLFRTAYLNNFNSNFFTVCSLLAKLKKHQKSVKTLLKLQRLHYQKHSFNNLVKMPRLYLEFLCLFNLVLKIMFYFIYL